MLLDKSHINTMITMQSRSLIVEAAMLNLMPRNLCFLLGEDIAEL